MGAADTALIQAVRQGGIKRPRCRRGVAGQDEEGFDGKD